MDDFLQLAKDRHSVRLFDQKKIEQEKLDKILEAGRVAPTAANFQPQRIFVLESDPIWQSILLTVGNAHHNTASKMPLSLRG